MTTEEILDAARFRTAKEAPYPFYLVQLSSTCEKKLDRNLVSDALVEHIKTADPPFSHVFLQTHGWNTPPDKAIRVPFAEFMAGMQNDKNVPSDESFNPLYVGFTWEALPLKFLQEEDALKKAELLEDAMTECELQDDKLVSAARELRRVAEAGVRDDYFKTTMLSLAQSDSEDDDDNEGAVAVVDEDDDQEEIGQVVEEDEAIVAERGFSLFKPVLKLFDPFQQLVFGRLIARGRKTGRVLQGVISKLMLARPNPTIKFCLMANSLGAHVVSGALMGPCGLPYKLHCAFIVQGAVNRDWFAPAGKYCSLIENVAGPVLCTSSAKDDLLRRIFAPFHGTAVGSAGFPDGITLPMLAESEYGERTYEWSCGSWNTIEATQFVDEGDPFTGGHGDFKENETTMAYWSAINTYVEPSKYLTKHSPEVEAEAEPEPVPDEQVEDASSTNCVIA